MVPTITGVYIRVSTEDQAKEGFSINAQKEKLTKYAELNDWDIFNFYIDDGISGKTIKDRPAINKMLNDLKNGRIKNILVYKLDRLTRSLLNLMELINLFERYECSLNSHTEKLDTSNAVGRMFVKILGTFAEFERENLAERISFGYEQKTREGNYTNTNGVYGYDYLVGEGKLKINQEEVKLVNRIYDLYLSNNSMLTICKMLNKEKVPTKRNGRWAQSTIKSILTNPLYIGMVRYGVKKKNNYKAFIVKGAQPLPIIETKKYNRVQKLIKKRTNFKTRRYSSDNTYYFHILKCGNCGSNMHARQQNQAGKLYISYACNGHRNGTCNAPGFSHQKMEKEFIKYLSQLQPLIPDDSVFVKTTKNNFDKDKQRLLNEQKKINLKKNELQNLFLEGSLLFEEYKFLIQKLIEKEKLYKQEDQIMFKGDIKNISISEVKKIVGNIKLNWQSLYNSERKIFLERFVDYMEVEKIEKEVKLLNIKYNC